MKPSIAALAVVSVGLVLRSQPLSAATFSSELVANLPPVTGAPFDSAPSEGAALGGFFYFAASDGTTGRELWRTDGTATGTTLVKDIRPGAADSNPLSFVLAGSQIFFTADDGVHGRELWRTDGTSLGTVLVKDMTLGPASTLIGEMKAAGNALCFAVYSDLFAQVFELFRTDGTAIGTFPLAGVGGAATTNRVASFDAVGSDIVFGALDFPDVSGKGTTNSIWRFSGTGPFGAVRMAAIPNRITAVRLLGNMCYFVARTNRCVSFFGDLTCLPVTQLMRINAFSTGPTQVVDTNQLLAISCGDFGCTPPSSAEFTGLTVSNGRLFYVDKGYEGGVFGPLREYFQGMRAVSNGSLPVSIESVGIIAGLFFPEIIGAINGQTHYLFGNQIRRTDGTAAGVTAFDFGSISVFEPMQVGTRYFFYSFDSNQVSQLGVTDLTTPGTRVLTVGTNQQNGVRLLLGGLGSSVLFQAREDSTGAELYRSDGTVAGTTLVKDIATGSDSPAPSEAVTVGNTLFFSVESPGVGRELWKSDGTAAGTALVADLRPGLPGSNPTNLTAFNGVLYFSANDGTNGVELWRSDGTVAGTFLLKDIRFGPSSSNPTLFTATTNRLFFVADDGAHGAELWISDGTAAGTQLAQDIVPGLDPGGIDSMSSVGDRVYFLGKAGGAGREPWVSDGRPGGTQFLKDLTIGSADSTLSPVVALNGVHYFLSGNGPSGGNLWRTDGTPEGTLLIKSGPYSLLGVVGSQLVLNQGAALFRSDGTAGGTVLLTNLRDFPDRFVAQGSQLFISANRFLYETDGTPNGTRLAAEFPSLDPFTDSTRPRLLTAHRGALVFVAGQPAFGRELWSLASGQAATLIEDFEPGNADADIRQIVAATDRIYYVVRPHGQGSWQVRKLTLQSLDLPPRGSFTGVPPRAPTRIEAENFDLGGEGRAFHDLTPANDGGFYRKLEAVDIEVSTDANGGFAVAFTQPGEWLEYTFEISQPGRYRLDTRVAADAVGGSFHFELDGVRLGDANPVPVPAGGWTTMAGPEILIGNGAHVLRLAIDTTNRFGTAGSFNWLEWVLTEPNLAPVVNIASPTHGQIFVPGSTAAFTIDVSDGTTLTAPVAEFLVDDLPVGGGPGVFQWNWPVTPGAHVLRVRVTDSFGVSVISPGRLFFGADPVVPFESDWKYFALGALPGTNWFDLDFDAARWSSGRTELGFGDGDETTTLPAINRNGNGIITYYFRRQFVVTNLPTYATATLRRDDGAVVYLNGREVWRANLPGRGAIIGYNTFAVTNLNNVTGGRVEEAVDVFDLPSRRFVPGTNILAVEVHQSTVTNVAQIDLSFDLTLSTFAYNPGSVLRIERAGPRNLVLWPDHLTDWVLEESFNLSDWAEVAGPFEVRDGFTSYGIDPGARGFYRLRLVAP